MLFDEKWFYEYIAFSLIKRIIMQGTLSQIFYVCHDYKNRTYIPSLIHYLHLLFNNMDRMLRLEPS